MTTFSSITTGQIDADSIIDTVIANQWSNNLIAVLEGDASAPHVTEDSHTTPTTGATYRHAQVSALIIGNEPSLTRRGELSIVVPRTGVYQLSFEMRIDNGTYTATARIYRNPATAYGGEVAFGTNQTAGGTSFVEKVQASVSLNAGDVLVIYASSNNAAANYEVKNFTLESAVKPFG